MKKSPDKLKQAMVRIQPLLPDEPSPAKVRERNNHLVFCLRVVGVVVVEEKEVVVVGWTRLCFGCSGVWVCCFALSVWRCE